MTARPAVSPTSVRSASSSCSRTRQRLARPRDTSATIRGVVQPPERLRAHDDRVGAPSARALDVAGDRRDQGRPAGRSERARPVDGGSEPEEGRFVLQDDEAGPLGAGDQEVDGRRAEVDRCAGTAGHGGAPSASSRAAGRTPVRPRRPIRQSGAGRGWRRSPASRLRALPQRASPAADRVVAFVVAGFGPPASRAVSEPAGVVVAGPLARRRLGRPVARPRGRRARQPADPSTSASSSAISSRTSASRAVRCSRLFLFAFSSRATRQVSSGRRAASANSSHSTCRSRASQGAPPGAGASGGGCGGRRATVARSSAPPRRRRASGGPARAYARRAWSTRVNGAAATPPA